MGREVRAGFGISVNSYSIVYFVVWLLILLECYIGGRDKGFSNYFRLWCFCQCTIQNSLLLVDDQVLKFWWLLTSLISIFWSEF